VVFVASSPDDGLLILTTRTRSRHSMCTFIEDASVSHQMYPNVSKFRTMEITAVVSTK